MPLPYFLTNKEWYEEVSLEESDRGFILTDKAPPEAVKSYEEFYNDTEIVDGDVYIIDK